MSPPPEVFSFFFKCVWRSHKASWQTVMHLYKVNPDSARSKKEALQWKFIVCRYVFSKSHQSLVSKGSTVLRKRSHNLKWQVEVEARQLHRGGAGGKGPRTPWESGPHHESAGKCKIILMRLYDSKSELWQKDAQDLHGTHNGPQHLWQGWHVIIGLRKQVWRGGALDFLLLLFSVCWLAMILWVFAYSSVQFQLCQKLEKETTSVWSRL